MIFLLVIYYNFIHLAYIVYLFNQLKTFCLLNIPLIFKHTKNWQQHYAKYNQKVFNIFQKESQILPLERAFSLSDTGEELRSPFQKYNMTNAEIQKVKQYYATALDLPMN